MSNLSISFRQANINDIATIVQFLSDDPLGAEREKFEDPIPEFYIEAFNAISNDPNNELFVATIGTEIVGTLQLTFIPGLSSARSVPFMPLISPRWVPQQLHKPYNREF